ncbi:MAG: RHS repeat-associated core domain-containing protein [Solirubrobacterales bacterium]
MTTSQNQFDPRFGARAPITASSDLTTPAGRHLASTHTRAAVLAGPENPITLLSQTDTSTVNGKVSTGVFQKTATGSGPFGVNTPFAKTTSSSPAGRQSTITLSSKQRPLNVSTPGVTPISATYDSRGRPTQIAQGERESSLSYDAAGNVASTTDALGRASTYEYDQAGRVTAEHLPGGRTTTYTYDAEGNVTSVTPAGRPAHGATYGLLGMIASATLPDAGEGQAATTYQYETPDHDLTRITRPSGAAASITYDPAGRLENLHTAAGDSAITYDPQTGNLSQMTAPGGVATSFTFDGGLPTGMTQSGPVAGQSTLTYNNDLQPASITAGGTTSAFSYDADGLLTGAGSMSIARRADNGLISGAALQATTTSTAYNAFAEPAGQSTALPGGGAYSETYVRDAAGRITEKQVTTPSGARTYAYAYNPAGQLENVTMDGAQRSSYSYDANGNRTAVTRGSGASAETTLATTDARDRMITSGDLTLAYNANGELTTRHDTSTGEETSFSYTTLGDMKAAELPGGRSIDYILDGAGRRVGKRVDGNLTQGFIHAPGILGPVAEQDGQGNTTQTFTYATRSNVPDYVTRGGNTYRMITDQLGSPRIVVNSATGAVAQEIEYDEFGRVLSDSNPGFQPFGFAGGIYDSDTKLTHFGAREYDAELGRWTSSDPIGFAGGDSNLYGYVLGDPVNLVDPSGLFKVELPALLPSLQETSDFAAGFGDGATWGLTKRIRKSLGVDGVVNYCSDDYAGGNITGTIERDLLIAVSPVGPAGALGKLPLKNFFPKRFWKFPPKHPSPLPPKTPSSESWGQMW